MAFVGFFIGTNTSQVDDDVVVALFEQQAASLVRAVSFLVDDVGEAEEIVQEAFTRLLVSRRRLRDIDRAPAYLRSTAFNLARSRLRKRGTARRNASKFVERPSDDPGSWAPHRSPEQVVLERAQQQALVEGLGRLPHRQRECLVMRFYLSLSEAEIAQTLGIAKGSVKTHTSRGLATLESQLRNEQ